MTEHESVELCALAGELGLTRGAAERAIVSTWNIYLSLRGGTCVMPMRSVPTYSLLPNCSAYLLVRRSPYLKAAGQSYSPIDGPASALHCGDRVVFTGDMDISRAEIETRATRAGLHATSSVSRKTALVVAADPYSQSGRRGPLKNVASGWRQNRSFFTCLTTFGLPKTSPPQPPTSMAPIRLATLKTSRDDLRPALLP